MKILAIDGNSIMNRAFYGIKSLSNKKGFFTNAITGFMNTYLKELEAVRPDCVAVAFDLKAPTFRHKAVSSYKANRKGMPDELAMQMPKIKEILSELGVKIIEAEGYEADDILGTISDIFSRSGNECFILTGDRDSFQLIRDNVTVRLAGIKETRVYTPEKIREEYGVEPEQMIDVKALMGDSSDNISGVKGIGEKTALSLIQKYGDIKNLYDGFREDEELSNGVKAKLEVGEQQAVESRFLAKIVLNVPIDTDVNAYKPGKVDAQALTETLSELEMFKLMDKLNLKDEFENKSLINDMAGSGLPDIKVCRLNNEIADYIAKSKNKLYFIFNRQSGSIYLEIMSENNVYFTDEKELAVKFFETSNEKLCFEGKEAYKFAFSNGAELKNIKFICDLAGYLLDSQASEYSVENLCASYGVVYRRDMGEYADISSLNSLSSRLKAEIELKEMEPLLYDIEQPLCEVLASMECEGVKVDAKGVKVFGEGLKKQINELEKDIYELAGKEFNISSPKQLGGVLFEDLSLPYKKKKTKSGGYSTNAEILESIKDTHPIVSMILEYRTLTKLNSTYVDGLLKLIQNDGRVRSIFKQTETRTGRISSTEPNMQNIPVRKKIGRNMRKFFVADEGNVLLDADYSQIELRVLAEVSGDENMQEAFINGEDVHTSTAAKVFDMPEDFVTDDMRRAAKTVNFGIIYGMGAFSLSEDLGVPIVKAKEYINDYFTHYPKVKEFMDKSVIDAQNNGYVTTVFGRRRYIPELTASSGPLRAFGKRVAMNAPIQGTAADIIKIAMVKVYQRLKAEKINAKLILQVHDELIIESSIEDKDKAKAILGEEMINAVKFKVPMIADVNEGKSWYEAKD